MNRSTPAWAASLASPALASWLIAIVTSGEGPYWDPVISGANDEWIITAILMLANHLGLRTVAEGVESEIQSTFLQGHDCREIQGYLISKPLLPDEFAERFLPRRNTARVPRTAQL